jgi:hypothetical protein
MIVPTIHHYYRTITAVEPVCLPNDGHSCTTIFCPINHSLHKKTLNRDRCTSQVGGRLFTQSHHGHPVNVDVYTVDNRSKGSFVRDWSVPSYLKIMQFGSDGL